MEENKDINSLIGFTLMGAVMLLWLWTQPPIEENITNDVIESQDFEEDDLSAPDNLIVDDIILNDNNDVSFNNSSEISDNDIYSFDNELISLEINSKGGFISSLFLKDFENYLENPIYLINEDNSEFNLNFNLKDNRNIDSKNLIFNSSSKLDIDGNLTVSMRHIVSDDQYLEYIYLIRPNDYMIDFSINSKGLSNIINTQNNYNLTWDYKSLRNSKSISYENRYSRLTYDIENNKIEKLGGMGGTADDEELVSELNWFSYRQHFFSAILVSSKSLNNVSLSQTNLSIDEDIDTIYTKNYISKIPLKFTNNEFDEKFQFYFGPTDSKILSNYDKNLESSIPFGWGIFGYINKSIFIPLFSYLSSIFPYGIAIIFMTILVRLVLSPVLYKSYLSQAKMKILKPEINEIAVKYKDNAMKKQQETMSLYNKAGANPMSGCLPAFIQIPVFYALFMFFPTAFDLRRKSFLWADDLSSYDNILDLPFYIPFYGDHVSLFPILASIAIFFYMKMTTGQQMSQQPVQEGMPDMGKMMKYMIYFSPLLMLVFFNNYASGLSLYYFISNLITIAIMLVIKNYILDENKIKAQIQLNKAKPQKKPGRFQKKMKQLMEEAEKQKRAQNRN
ncbi:MAG: membrane protein insertase YidC [Flavobacteriaceae bacterium]|nr:membrane protein insertase YidC [Flavobacteriaceae bacterium]